MNANYSEFIISLLIRCDDGDKDAIDAYNKLIWHDLSTKIVFDSNFVAKLKSLSNTNKYAMNILGLIYQYGRGVKQDLELALVWYTKAASCNLETAMANLGTAYYNGNIVKQDYFAAFEWWTKAASLGSCQGLFGLGRIYEMGYGVESDESLAVEWYTKSAAMD